MPRPASCRGACRVAPIKHCARCRPAEVLAGSAITFPLASSLKYCSACSRRLLDRRSLVRGSAGSASSVAISSLMAWATSPLMFGPSTRPPNVAALDAVFDARGSRAGWWDFARLAVGRCRGLLPIPIPGVRLIWLLNMLPIMPPWHAAQPSPLQSSQAMASFAISNWFHRGVEHFHFAHFLLHLIELLGHFGHGIGRLLIVALLQCLLGLPHLLGQLLHASICGLLLLHLVELLLQLTRLGQVALFLLLLDLLLKLVHRLLPGLPAASSFCFICSSCLASCSLAGRIEFSIREVCFRQLFRLPRALFSNRPASSPRRLCRPGRHPRFLMLLELLLVGRLFRPIAAGALRAAWPSRSA